MSHQVAPYPGIPANDLLIIKDGRFNSHRNHWIKQSVPVSGGGIENLGASFIWKF